MRCRSAAPTVRVHYRTHTPRGARHSKGWLERACHNPTVSRETAARSPENARRTSDVGDDIDTDDDTRDGGAEHAAGRVHPRGLAIFLIIAGVIGWIAAFQLTIEKFHLLQNPGSTASCDFNIVVQCGANLGSAQGALFGFPNPLIGLGAWVAPIAVGVAILAGARFARWFWVAFNAGLLGALVFVIWLISQSIFVLGTLCPWCMVTWSVTIPAFLAVTLYNLGSGNIPVGASGRRVARSLAGWVPLITVLCYVVIAILAQVRLDFLSFL